MNNKSIGYHTRLSGQNSVKLVGGSFGGPFGMETVERLVKHHFKVEMRPSGRPIFVDREGRHVMLYVTVDPETTEAGKAALADYRAAQAKAGLDAEGKARRIQALMEELSDDEILRRLGDENTPR